MTTRDELRHATELLNRLLPLATPGPWRDSVVDGNRYAALVAPESCANRPHRFGCHTERQRQINHDGYGGCLIAETMLPEDRRLLAVLRNVADHLPEILRAVADEDPIAVGRHTRGMAAAIIGTHTPRTPA